MWHSIFNSNYFFFVFLLVFLVFISFCFVFILICFYSIPACLVAWTSYFYFCYTKEHGWCSQCVSVTCVPTGYYRHLCAWWNLCDSYSIQLSLVFYLVHLFYWYRKLTTSAKGGQGGQCTCTCRHDIILSQNTWQHRCF